jgi:hypothetical protein
MHRAAWHPRIAATGAYAVIVVGDKCSTRIAVTPQRCAQVGCAAQTSADTGDAGVTGQRLRTRERVEARRAVSGPQVARQHSTRCCSITRCRLVAARRKVRHRGRPSAAHSAAVRDSACRRDGSLGLWSGWVLTAHATCNVKHAVQHAVQHAFEARLDLDGAFVQNTFVLAHKEILELVCNVSVAVATGARRTLCSHVVVSSRTACPLPIMHRCDSSATSAIAPALRRHDAPYSRCRCGRG